MALQLWGQASPRRGRPGWRRVWGGTGGLYAANATGHLQGDDHALPNVPRKRSGKGDRTSQAENRTEINDSWPFRGDNRPLFCRPHDERILRRSPTGRGDAEGQSPTTAAKTRPWEGPARTRKVRKPGESGFLSRRPSLLGLSVHLVPPAFRGKTAWAMATKEKDLILSCGN